MVLWRFGCRNGKSHYTTCVLFSGFFISVIYFRFPGIRNILIYLLFRFPEEIFRYIYGIPVSRNKTNIYFGAFRFPGISKYIFLEHSGFSAVTGPYRSRFRKFKLGFGAQIAISRLPFEIASEFDKI